MSGKTEITLNKKQEVTISGTESLYAISRRDWQRLTKAIKKIKPVSSTWLNVAWGTLGMAFSCLISWLTNKDEHIISIIGCTAFAISICSFIANKSERKVFLEPVTNLNDVFQEIEDEINKENDE